MEDHGAPPASVPRTRVAACAQPPYHMTDDPTRRALHSSMTYGGFMPRHARVLVLLLSTLAAACASPGTLSTSGPFDTARAPDEGLRYFLTRDLLTVDAKVSQFREVVRGRSGACESHDSVATSWTLTVTTVPDRRQAYRLGLTPSGLLDQTLGVKVSETGVLTSLNYAGTDQRGAVATIIAKGVAGVIGALAHGGLTAGRDTSCATPGKTKPVPRRRGTSSEPSISPSCRPPPIPAQAGRRSRVRTRRSRTISSSSRWRISSSPCRRFRSRRAHSSRRPARAAPPLAARAPTRCARRSIFASRSCA